VSKRFSNNKVDAPLVITLYARAFEQSFTMVKCLAYEGLGWGNHEAMQLAAVLRHKGGLRHLQTLRLRGNQIGNNGASALASACLLLPKLCSVDVSDNRIRAKGMEAIASAHAWLQAHARLVSFRLCDNPVEPPAAMGQAPDMMARVEEQRKRRLLDLRMMATQRDARQATAVEARAQAAGIAPATERAAEARAARRAVTRALRDDLRDAIWMEGEADA